MAKITVDTSHVFTSGRGESESVADALAWLDKHMTETDEETGEESTTYTPGDLIVYAVRRMRALHKDGKRVAKGKLASRLYAPRLDMLADGVKVPKALTEAVESIGVVEEKMHPAPAAKPEKKASKPAAAKPGKASVPRVHVKGARVVGKVAPSAGGAEVKF